MSSRYVSLAFLSLVGLSLLIAVAAVGCADIDPGQVGIRIIKLGRDRRVEPTPLQVGWHFYNRITTDIVVYDTRAKEYHFTEVETREPVGFQTVDGLEGTADITFTISLDPKRVFQLHQDVGPGYLDRVVRPALRSLPRIELGRFGAEKIYTGEVKETIQERTRISLNKALTPFGMEVRLVALRRVRFSPDFTKKLEEKAIALQQVEINHRHAQAAEEKAKQVEAEARGQKLAEVQKAEGQRQGQILRAQGESQALKLQAEGQLAVALAEAKGVEAKRQALSGPGGKELVSIEWAKHVGPNIKVGLVPTGSPGTISVLGDSFGGRILELFGQGEEKKPEKKAERK